MDEPHVWLASGDDEIRGRDDTTDEDGDPIPEETEEDKEDVEDDYSADSKP
jgi:hypothetical protein